VLTNAPTLNPVLGRRIQNTPIVTWSPIRVQVCQVISSYVSTPKFCVHFSSLQCLLHRSCVHSLYAHRTHSTPVFYTLIVKAYVSCTSTNLNGRLSAQRSVDSACLISIHCSPGWTRCKLTKVWGHNSVHVAAIFQLAVVSGPSTLYHVCFWVQRIGSRNWVRTGATVPTFFQQHAKRVGIKPIQILKMTVVWDAALCSREEVYRRFTDD
jgi:hypothetical protein